MDWKKPRDGWDRWACLAAAMVMEACGGLGYTFGVYSQHLKERLDYTQEDLDDVGAAKDFGYAFGILGGIIYNFTPPWLTVCIGGLLHFLGYFMVYMTSAGKITPPFILVCTFIALGTGGDSWMDTAAIMTSVQNFTDYRGTALGVLKAQVGLSGAIFVTLYKAFLKPNVDGYVLLVAVAPAIASMSLAVFVRPFPKDSSDSNGDERFRVAYGATILLGVYLLLSIAIQTWRELTKPWLIFFAVTMLIQFALVCFTLTLHGPIRRMFNAAIGTSPDYSSSQEMISKPSLKSKSSNIHLRGVSLEDDDDRPLKSENVGSQENPPDRFGSNASQMMQKDGYYILEPSHEDPTPVPESVSKQSQQAELAAIDRLTLVKCVRSLDFWILCLVAVTGPGTGLAVINNFGQMGRALRSESTELYVGLISVASCFGRLIAGYGSDVMTKITPYPRPMFLTLAHLTMTVGCLILAAGYVPSLYLGAILVGGSYGAFWAVTPAIIAEVFGLQNFAALYKLIGACGPIGAYLLSAKIVGQFYDQEAELDHTRAGHHSDELDGDENNCFGKTCFGFSMLVLAVVCILGASLGTILSLRTRRLYALLK